MVRKILLSVLALCLICSTAFASETELLTIDATDGYQLEGKLDLPDSQPEKLVIFINGSGPNTYDNKRQFTEDSTFNYFDTFAENLTAGGDAFFRWSTRGCTPGTEPPVFTDIDEAAYQTYIPENSISDVESVITALKSDARLADCPVYLLGWSEGTMIASHVAARGNATVDGLVLCGYSNGTMYEALEWQQTGGASMVFYKQYFDADGHITQAEYEADPYAVIEAIGNSSFADIDLDGDGELTATDFKMMLAESWAQLQAAIQRGDDEWLAQNYGVRLTSAWFNGHAELAPNREILPTLDIPIFILHGECDGNAPVQGAYDIADTFAELGKTNLTLNVYPDHDHDLNFAQLALAGTMPAGFADLFSILTE